jgi:hypothetical protein
MTSLKDELAKSVWWARMAEEVGPQVKAARVASRWRRQGGYGGRARGVRPVSDHTGFEVWRLRGWQNGVDWPDALVKIKAAIKIQTQCRHYMKRCVPTPPQNVFITPIAKKKKNKGNGGPDSRRDWDEQEERAAIGLQLMWDGPKPSLPQPDVGDLLTVWKHRRNVTLYRITHISDPSVRPTSWAANIGQSDRSVLYLADPKVIEWDNWIALGGHNRCMGTGRVVGASRRIIDTWNSM